MIVSVWLSDPAFHALLLVSMLAELSGPFVITFAFTRHRLPLHIEHFAERNGLLVMVSHCSPLWPR